MCSVDLLEHKKLCCQFEICCGQTTGVKVLGYPRIRNNKQYTFNNMIYRIEIIKQFLIYFIVYNLKNVVQ